MCATIDNFLLLIAILSKRSSLYIKLRVRQRHVYVPILAVLETTFTVGQCVVVVVVVKSIH